MLYWLNRHCYGVISGMIIVHTLLTVAAVSNLVPILFLIGCAGNQTTTTRTETLDTTPVTDAAKVSIESLRIKHNVEIEEWKVRAAYLAALANKMPYFAAAFAIGIFLFCIGNKWGIALAGSALGGGICLAIFNAFLMHPYAPIVGVAIIAVGGVCIARQLWVRQQATDKEVEYAEHTKLTETSEQAEERRKAWEAHKPKSKAVQKRINKDLAKIVKG